MIATRRTSSAASDLTTSRGTTIVSRLTRAADWAARAADRRQDSTAAGTSPCAMASVPTLVPLPPQHGRPIALQSSPFWLGSHRGAGHQVFLPGVGERHVALVERGDGYWVIPGSGSAAVNGNPIGTGVVLQHGDVIRVAPGCEFRFDSGVVAPAESTPVADPVVAVRAKRRRPRGLATRVPRVFIIAASIAAVLIVGAVVVIVRGLTRSEDAAQLSPAEIVVFDSVLAVAYEHVERGTALLEIGARPQALQEFAAGVNALKTSSLRAHPYVVPRIDALESSVAAIYREKQVAVPVEYARAAARTPTPSAVFSRSLHAALSTAEFVQRFDSVRQAFSARFRTSLTITGADHAEHVSLYGRGGALDIRTRNLSAEQIQFVIGQCRAAGIRVKDFSQDSVLKRQIQSAIRAGLADRAGTGVHLHVDRFANRRDAFTVQ